MDIADISDTHETTILESEIAKIRQKTKESEIKRTGRCLNCDEPCEGLFCCIECRNDYEHAIKCLKISGKHHE